MEEIIVFIFIWLFVEVILFIFFYGTGWCLTPIVSFGKWKPDSIFRDDSNKIKIKNQSGISLLNKFGNIYLGVGGVIGLGVLFWIIFIVFILAL